MDETERHHSEERDAAVRVWVNARRAAGEPPSRRRVARVEAKVADPDCTLVTVSMTDRVVGMLLAEPFRAAAGCGDMVPGWGHISMVFVEPRFHRRGVGSRLIRALGDDQRWNHLSVWTRVSNHAAQGLYRTHRFNPVGEKGVTSAGELIERLERRASG